MPLDDEQLEHAVLMEIIALHPAHPTRAELRLAMSAAYEDPGVKQLMIRFGLSGASA